MSDQQKGYFMNTSWLIVDKNIDLDNKIKFFIKKNKMVVSNKTDGIFSIKQGSYLTTRFLGTYFTPARFLPKQIIIEMEELDKGTRVKFQIKEDVGLGILNNNLKNKLKCYFNLLSDDLEKTIYG